MRLDINNLQKNDTQQDKEKVEYFKLENNGDSAEVQFLYSSIEDIEILGLHRTKNKKGWNMYIDCLRKTKEDSQDLCPYCKAGKKLSYVMYLVLLDHRDNKVKIWQRTMGFFDTIQNNVFADFTDIHDKVFKITRNGEKGSKDTTYNIGYSPKKPLDTSNVQKPNIKSILFTLTKEQMENRLKWENGDITTETISQDKVVSQAPAEKESWDNIGELPPF